MPNLLLSQIQLVNRHAISTLVAQVLFLDFVVQRFPFVWDIIFLCPVTVPEGLVSVVTGGKTVLNGQIL